MMKSTWKTILGIAGGIAGYVTLRVMAGPVHVQFVPAWYFLLHGLIGASFGLCLGMMADARRVYWKPILGIVGLVVGALVGFAVVVALAGQDSFPGEVIFKGIVIGTPVGALLGCILGILLGTRFGSSHST
ncbi:MAG: hypothetical protein IH987_10570 [Planctomycetes bacterium]|nr:hypothetical protein [Planctomycetota bacterium]